MIEIKKILNKIGLKKEKIIFCYFEFDSYNYTPLDVGYVLAILKKNGMYKKYNFEIFKIGIPCNSGDSKKTENHLNKITESILTLKSNAVFFFSDNVISSLFTGAERAKKIAIKIKEKNHKVFIGLQGSRLDAAFIQKLLATRKVDCVIHDNPENALLFLDNILERKKVSGVIHNFSEIKDEKNKCQKSGAKGVKKEYLDRIPSPYLSGILDDILCRKKNLKGADALCFLQSSRGCVFGCYYCSRSIKFESVRCFSPERFYDEIEYLVSKFGFSQFFVIDDAFVVFKKKLLDFRCEFEKRKIKNEKLENISLFIMTRVENLDKEVILILKDINVTDIQIGIQTINPALQYYMNRNVGIQNFIDISENLKEAKIKFLLDIIVGLPNDTVEWFEKTLDFAIKLAPNRIQINQFSLAPETLFYRDGEKFGIKSTKSHNEFRRLEVLSSNGINKAYYAQVHPYVQEKRQKHPEIGWLIFFYK